MKNSLLSRFDTHVAMCSALGVAATMAAPQQEAEAVDYVYYQPNGGAGWVVPATTSGLYINVETQVASTTTGGALGWDINPWGSSKLSWFRDAGAGSAYMRFPGVVTGSNPGNLALGTTVDAAASYSTSGVNDTVFGPNPGEWKLNSPNYLGFSFIGADAGTHYGWLRIDVGASNLTRTIMEVGYSSVIGQAVIVGQAVPEPSTVIMGLLASGATGVIAWRRRRQTA